MVTSYYISLHGYLTLEKSTVIAISPKDWSFATKTFIIEFQQNRLVLETEPHRVVFDITLSLFEVSNYVVIPLGVCVQLRAFDTKLRK